MPTRFLACAGILLLLAHRPLCAQDTARAPMLPDVVVTAERASIPLASSTAAITVLSREQIRALPARNLADALRQVPGLSFVDFSGSGSDPQLMVRGFYGGGEVDYVLVLLDGERINTPGSGRVNWDLVPLDAVESVEVLRGAASPLYGDAAIGAVINIRTAGRPLPPAWSVAGGQHGLARLSTRVSGGDESRSASVFGDVARQDGFRDHSRRETASLGARVTSSAPGGGGASLSLVGHRREFEDPGPLTDALLGTPGVSMPFFRFDETREDFLRALARVAGNAGRSARVSTQLSYDLLDRDATRTVPLAAEFADTKRRLLDESRVSSSTQVEAQPRIFGRESRLIAGFELDRGALSSTYFDHTTGDAEAYAAASAAPAATGEEGSARRVTAAAFVQQELLLSPRLRFVLGARWDRVSDRFREDAGSSAPLSARHGAFSPRAAVNFGYARSSRQRGHLFASAGRSFKAPTLDQLFDRRTVPVPFPPFAITFSNYELRPQHARSFEAGARHWILPASGTTVELSVVGYSVRMIDELDFDVQQLRYMNIGRSRHDGLEAGMQATSTGIGSAFVTYSLQDATSRTGENSGKQLKAIPRSNARVGFARTAGAADVSFVVNHVGRAFLDDANTRHIPAYTTADAKLGYRVRGVRVWLAAFNLFDRRYSTTGFGDPAGSDVSFFYPASGRVIQAGLSSAP